MFFCLGSIMHEVKFKECIDFDVALCYFILPKGEIYEGVKVWFNKCNKF